MEATKTKDEFLRWYAPIHGAFLRYCDARFLGLAEAEDLVQDAVLAALEQWTALEDKNRLLAYLIGIVNHQVKNRLRSREVHRRYLLDRKRVLDERLPNNPEAALDLQFLLRAVDMLPAAEREALLLRTVSGFSVREVADIQGISPGAVKTRVSRARKRLREMLAEDGRPLTVTQRLRIYAAILL
ncbi:RNA polymerase sigma factor [Lewinella sp. W8]|uniref:RNA polymerase sigma factor n=1 Tax=Lewinella sp. W8 TaxID=2528208 RepID=UPI0010678A5C|nr:RNA polymerase sigma factor [Lewinella sp. W8]MTB50049.1 sigma-70 family RNA polymerase sigma factor [Lewinella sp. W8]